MQCSLPPTPLLPFGSLSLPPPMQGPQEFSFATVPALPTSMPCGGVGETCRPPQPSGLQAGLLAPLQLPEPQTGGQQPGATAGPLPRAPVSRGASVSIASAAGESQTHTQSTQFLLQPQQQQPQPQQQWQGPGNGGLLVPVDYASSKLWGVTSEYENLLNIQRDQHVLALNHKEAEAKHLRQRIEILEAGDLGQDSFIVSLRAKEEEVTMALQAKQRELELFANLLQMRDRQIGDLQEMCEAKQAEVLRLQSTQPAAPSAEAMAEAVRLTEELRYEKAELERLLTTKDRQISASQKTSHDSVLQTRELREEVARLRSHTEDLEAEVSDKRSELKDLTAALSSKMQRVLELESERERMQRDKQQAAQDFAARLAELQEQLAEWQRDCRTTEQLVEELKAELAKRDERFVQQQAECTQQKVGAQQLECKVEELGAQLAHAEEALAEVMRSNHYKDRLVREMTQQVNISETKLHSYQINELIGSRHRPSGPVDASFEPAAKLPPGNADEPHAEPSAAGSALYLAGGHTEFNGSGPVEGQQPGDRPSHVRSLSTTTGGTAPPPARRCVLDLAKMGIPDGRFPLEDSPLWSASSSRGPSPERAPPPREHSEPQTSAAATSLASVPPHLVQSYRPHPGDAVDASLAAFVNRAENSACRALFCRLSEGSYLFGTLRASLRLHPRNSRLEAQLEGEWVPLADFLARAERSQARHLQRSQ